MTCNIPVRCYSVHKIPEVLRLIFINFLNISKLPGGILGGIFTATEASAIAVVYTFILSVLIYREVKWRDLPKLILESVVTTSIVLLLIGFSVGMS